MKTNPVGWFEIYVQDMERAKTFYESVLQVRLESLNSPAVQMWAFPGEHAALGGAGGSLVQMGRRGASGGNSILVYFSCEDCAVEEGRVEAAGGRVHRQKMSIGEYALISLVVDTEGNMFGLHSMR